MAHSPLTSFADLITRIQDELREALEEADQLVEARELGTATADSASKGAIHMFAELYDAFFWLEALANSEDKQLRQEVLFLAACAASYHRAKCAARNLPPLDRGYAYLKLITAADLPAGGEELAEFLGAGLLALEKEAEN